MILGIIINFSILFTFIIFSYFILEYFQEKSRSFTELQPLIIGILATAISLFLMKTSIVFDNGLIGDTRNISILLSGLLGGPYALLISSTLVGLFRVFLFDFNTVSIVSGLNIIILGIIIFLFARQKAISHKTIHYYLYFQTIEIACVLFFLHANKTGLIELIAFFIITNIVGFYVTFCMIKLFHCQFERIRSVEKKAKTDYITDLPNLRSFSENFNVALQSNKNFSILLIDLVELKQINQQYGHSYGDEILQELAVRLKKFSEEFNAFPSRIGDKEFYLLCYDAPPALGIHHASELLLQMKKNPFVLSDGQHTNLSLAIGVASYPDNGSTLEVLTTAVDRASSHAKNKGNESFKIVHANHLKKQP